LTTNQGLSPADSASPALQPQRSE